jgi:hypothetical protein
MDLGSIAKCAIHPAIGIARVGNSPNEHFVGPEVPGVDPDPGLTFKDASGAIKRQIAKFRIYGLDVNGNVIKELTADDADISWTVHLANKKASWYSFTFPMDIPEAKAVSRRNPSYPGDRKNLSVDPGPRSVSGRDARAVLDKGTFLGVDVPLGEIQTDSYGNLLVFGGFGKSNTISNQPITGFDNVEWFDDTSDGPVSAQVTIGGKDIEVEPAWVIVGPPNYAPGIPCIVTLYDLVYEVATQKGLLMPDQVSFTDHIYPLLERFCKLQWVNEGFYLEYGWGAPNHFLDEKTLEKLSSNSADNYTLRQSLFNLFRNPASTEVDPFFLPPVYGDAINDPPIESPRKYLTVTRLQYGWLREWAVGNFQADWDPKKSPGPQKLEDLPLSERPCALDRAALEACEGGPFHPGSEASWPMRNLMLYSAPFRIKRRPRDEPEKDYGDQLTPEVAIAADGPLSSCGPGDITRWMSIPWQVDVVGCGTGYEPKTNPYLPTFWPARAPNHVLTEDSFQQVLNVNLSLIQRLKYFGTREDWLRDIVLFQQYDDRVIRFLKEWYKVGVIVRREVPPGSDFLPAEVYIEVQNQLQEKPDDRYVNIDPRIHR